MLSLDQRSALLGAVPAFATLTSEELNRLADECREERHPSGTVVIAEGAVGNDLYILADGCAEVSVTIRKRAVPLAVLEPGEMFGELALLTNDSLRQATVTLAQPSTLLVLTRAAFEDILAEHPAIRRGLDASAERTLVAKFLKLASPFAPLDRPALDRLAASVDQRSVPAGMFVLREGEPGDAAYLIRTGKVEVVLGAGAAEHALATLGPGALFGETALLTDMPRNASVRATEPVELLVLARADFLAAVSSQRDVGAEMFRLMQTRERPKRRGGIETFQRSTPEGDTITVLRDHARHRYFQLSEHGWFLWQRCDGEHTMRMIALDYLHAFKAFAPDVIASVVGKLLEAGFLESRMPHPGAIGSLARPSWGRGMVLSLRHALTWQAAIGGADALLGRLYQGGVRYLYTTVAQLILGALSVAGIAAFALGTGKAVAALQMPGGAAWLWLLIPAQLLNIALHEAGHAFTVKSAGREVGRIGIGWYWFGPVAFVDTTDMWLSGRRARVAVTLAGPYANIVTAGVAALFGWFLSGAAAVTFCWEFALLSYLSVLINLNPLLEYDGYYVLADLLERPDLRQRALRGRFRGGRGDLVFGLCAVLYVSAASVIMFMLTRTLMGGMLPEWRTLILAWTAALAVPALSIAAVLGELLLMRNRADE